MARPKVFPPNFNSMEEYESYVHCVSKVSPGDTVEAYFRAVGRDVSGPNARYAVSHRPNDYTKEIIIVGKRFDRGPADKFSIVFLVGTNESNLGFWPMQDEWPQDHFPKSDVSSVRTKELINQLRFGYWVYNYDLRFKKIIKSNAL